MKMDNSDIEKKYLLLLRSALRNEEIRDVEMSAQDVEGVINMAQQQGTAAIIAEGLLRRVESGELRVDKYALKSICAQNMMAQERQKILLRQVQKVFRAGGIEPVVIKGLTLARHYPKPYLRQCGDIDIYVGKDNYHKGAKILREAFPDAPRFDTEEEYFKHYNINVGEIPIEMHRVSVGFQHPKDVALYDKLEDEGLRTNAVHYSNGEDEWTEPEWNFNVLLTFIHSWEHFISESANIRQIVDLRVVLENGEQGADKGELEQYLRTNLKGLHLLKAWQLYAYIMVNYLGLEKEKCPLYTDKCKTRADRLLRWIMDGHTHERRNDRPAPKNIILRKIYTLGERMRTAKEISKIEPHYARHSVEITFAQSWERFKKGENTRKWE